MVMSNDAMRNAFTAWYKKDGDLHDTLIGADGRFVFLSVQRDWEIWQAALAAPAQSEAKPVARCPDCFGAGVYAKAAILPEPPDVQCARCNGTGKDYTAPSAAPAGDGGDAALRTLVLQIGSLACTKGFTHEDNIQSAMRILSGALAKRGAA